MGALLLVAFANHASSALSGTTSPTNSTVNPESPHSRASSISSVPSGSSWKKYTKAGPLSPSEDCPSDSGSEATLAHHLPRASDVSDAEFDESDDYEDSESEGYGDKSTIKSLRSGSSLRGRSETDGGEAMGRRLRVGQHYSKRRHRTTAEQLRILEMTYAGNKVPNQELRKDLSIQLGMTTRRVQIWFQNKRAKEKRLRVDLHQKGGVPTQSVVHTSSNTSSSTSNPASASSRPGSPVESSALRAPVVPQTSRSQHSLTPSTSPLFPNPLLFLRNDGSGNKMTDLSALFKAYPGMEQNNSGNLPTLWMPPMSNNHLASGPNTHMFYPPMFAMPSMQMQVHGSNNPSMMMRQPLWGMAPLH